MKSNTIGISGTLSIHVKTLSNIALNSGTDQTISVMTGPDPEDVEQCHLKSGQAYTMNLEKVKGEFISLICKEFMVVQLFCKPDDLMITHDERGLMAVVN